MRSWLSDTLSPGWLTIAVAVGLVVAVTANRRTGALATLRSAAGGMPPETRPRPYNRDDVESYAWRSPQTNSSAYSKRASVWILYKKALTWDVAFALVVGLGLVVLLDGSLGLSLKSREGLSWLILLIPIGGALADVAEDVLLLSAVHERAEGHISSVKVQAAMVMTLVKFVLDGTAVLLIAVGTGTLVTLGVNNWTPPPASLLILTVILIGYQFIPSVLAKLDRNSSALTPAARALRRSLVGTTIVLPLSLYLLLGPDWCSESSFGCGADNDLSHILKGVAWGGFAVGLFAGVTALVISFPLVRRRIQDVRYEGFGLRGLAGRSLLILIGTSLPEEIIFRGVLLAAWTAEGYSLSAAIILSSITFGLWHVAPELGRIRENRRAAAGAKAGGLVGVIAFTTVAGVGFSLLRVHTGAIWAGVVVHAGINIFGMTAAWKEHS